MKTCKSYERDGKGTNGRTAGREQTLDSLLRRHASQAHQFAYSLARNQEEAKELVQEASYHALRHWERYDPVGSFKNWYLTIVKNLFLDTRNRFARRRTVSLDQPLGGDEQNSLIEVLPDGEPGPLEGLERLEAIQAARQALAALGKHYQAVLTLCDLEGLRYEDAARKLGIPLGTVRSRLFRAREALRGDPRLRGYA